MRRRRFLALAAAASVLPGAAFRLREEETVESRLVRFAEELYEEAKAHQRKNRFAAEAWADDIGGALCEHFAPKVQELILSPNPTMEVLRRV